MSRLCLDTSVISELAPGRTGLPRPWLDVLYDTANSLIFSSMTVAEIEEGISKLRRAGGLQRANGLRAWLDAFLDNFEPGIVAIDTELARTMGRLSDAAWAIGRNPGCADIAIAATAAQHQAVLLTRNIRYFEPLGVAAIDPFLSPPP